MSRTNKIATVFGGTGFVGRQVVRELAKRGLTVKVATRVPERAYFLKPSGSVGQIVPFACNYNDPASIADAVQGAEYVVNCIGILRERRRGGFSRAHAEIPAEIAKSCTKAGVRRFVHISALGVDKAKSRYAASKREGEKAVAKNFANATILRPSVIFGEDDSFFKKFAEMARYLPALPLIGGGKTRFQPVFVGDVADAVIAALTRPAVNNENPMGKTYELGGPETVSFKEIYQRLFQYTGRKRALIPLPFFAAKIQAFFLGFLPNPPLTCDQVNTLKTDNVVGSKALTLEDLGIHATAMDMVLPRYLETYLPGGRLAQYHNTKAAA